MVDSFYVWVGGNDGFFGDDPHLVLGGQLSGQFAALYAPRNVTIAGDTAVSLSAGRNWWTGQTNVHLDSAYLRLWHLPSNNGITINSDVIEIAADSTLVTNNLHVADTLFADFGSITTSLYVGDTLFAEVYDVSYGEMGHGYFAGFTLPSFTQTWVTNGGNNLWSTNATELNGVTYDGDSLVIDRAGLYHISGHLSADRTTGSILELAVFRNGVPTCSCESRMSWAADGVLTVTIPSDIIRLSQGDVLKVYAYGSSGTFDLRGGRLTVHRID
jgi:hypothetical protein